MPALCWLQVLEALLKAGYLLNLPQRARKYRAIVETPLSLSTYRSYGPQVCTQHAARSTQHAAPQLPRPVCSVATPRAPQLPGSHH